MELRSSTRKKCDTSVSVNDEQDIEATLSKRIYFKHMCKFKVADLKKNIEL